MDKYYQQTVKEKEEFIDHHPLTQRIPHNLLVEFLTKLPEEHFVHGHSLVERDTPAKEVYLIKTGFARVYYQEKFPKSIYPASIQHLPSTKLRQRLKTVEVEVIDIGPGEFVGALEQFLKEDKYMYTIRVVSEMVAYKIRGMLFKDIILRTGSATAKLFKEDLQTRFNFRSATWDKPPLPKAESFLIKQAAFIRIWVNRSTWSTWWK